MANLIGARTTAQLTTETRAIRSVDEQIALLEPNEAPLITILTLASKMRKGAGSTKVEHFEDAYVPQWGATDNAGYAADATTINVADGTLFAPGDVILIPKAVNSATAPELMRVTAVSTNALTVVRGFAGSTAAIIAAAVTPIRILGSAIEENGAKVTSKTTTKLAKYNYMQIFRTAFEVSRTAMQTAAYGAPAGEWNNELKKRLIEHKREMNSAFLFGKATATTAGGKPLRTCDGLNSIVSSNVYDGGGTLTEKAFDAFLEMSFRYGSRTKIGVFAPRIMRAVHAWGKSKLHLATETTAYGMKLVRVLTPFGELMLMNDWMLENPAGGSTAGFAGWGFICDPENMFYRFLNGNPGTGTSDTKLSELTPEKNLATDGSYGEYLTEACPQFKLEQTFSKIYNVTDYS
jgi:hypothetical protein